MRLHLMFSSSVGQILAVSMFPPDWFRDRRNVPFPSLRRVRAPRAHFLSHSQKGEAGKPGDRTASPPISLYSFIFCKTLL